MQPACWCASRAAWYDQGIDPDDLFPGVEFRISEEEDEDMPYTRPADFQPRRRRHATQERALGARQPAKSPGANAVRALQAQQKAGAKSSEWGDARGTELGVQVKERRKDASPPPRAEPGKVRPGGQEPSVGRGPIGRAEERKPDSVNAQVRCVGEA